MFHKGKNGKTYANPQVRDHADKSPMAPPKKESEGMDGKIPMGDEQPGDGEVPQHLEALHKAMGGIHMHVHQGEDGKLTSHHVGEDGMVEGPHEHGDMEALKQHQHEVFGHDEGMGAEPEEAMHGLRHALGGMQ